MSSGIGQRKADHLDLCAKEDVGFHETGTLFGDDPPELVAIEEATASGASVRLWVDVKRCALRSSSPP